MLRCNETYGKVWKFPCTMPYVTICFMARYMEISMYLSKYLYARLRQSMWQGVEISMYLAICYLARYMEISTYLACPMFHRKVHGNFHVPCQMFACEIATKHMASYGNFHVLTIWFIARYIKISMYLAKVCT